MAHFLPLDSACMAIVGEDDIACVAVSSAQPKARIASGVVFGCACNYLVI